MIYRARSRAWRSTASMPSKRGGCRPGRVQDLADDFGDAAESDPPGQESLDGSLISGVEDDGRGAAFDHGRPGRAQEGKTPLVHGPEIEAASAARSRMGTGAAARAG